MIFYFGNPQAFFDSNILFDVSFVNLCNSSACVFLEIK